MDYASPGLDSFILALKQKFGFAKNQAVLGRPAIDGIVLFIAANPHQIEYRFRNHHSGS